MLKTDTTPRRVGFVGDLFESLTERGRRLLGWRHATGPEALESPDLAELGKRLLSRRGEASGVVIARALLAAYEDANLIARLAFLQALADGFGPDSKAVKSALASLQKAPEDPEAMEALHSAAEPSRQELLRRLNLAPGGTAALVRMREDLLRHLHDTPGLRRLTRISRISSDLGSIVASLASGALAGPPRPASWRR